jgi:hypothetical protein
MTFEELPLWSRQKSEICQTIAASHAPLKVVLKTKDDPALLQSWIDHHRSIVGIDGLIILDNISTSQDVLNVYENYVGRIPIFRYAGFHNDIHSADRFSDLYDALKSSCEYFVFLDTDERLVLFDGDIHFNADNRILEFLRASPHVNVFPGTWLQNVTGYSDRFSLYDPIAPLTVGLKWGKPVISATCGFAGMINHNTQVDHALYDDPIVTNFFILHLSRISGQQRINANLKKLRAYGELAETAGIQDLRDMGLGGLRTDQAKMYAKEIFDLLASDKPLFGPISGSIQIKRNGQLICSADWQYHALQQFVTRPFEYTSALLET